jgi:hypothetical protein
VQATAAFAGALVKGTTAGQTTLEITNRGTATLNAKIGELTLENDFLAGALSKAGLLSAKR